jgi:GNAT superfamily N-acetyltransferase
MSSIRVTCEDPRGEVASAFIARVSAELDVLYHELYSEDGAGAFTPEDVVIPRAAFVVAWQGETPVGCGMLRPTDDPAVAEVKRMYVDAAMRGQGIARMILAGLEEQACVLGYQRIVLETGIRQPNAIRLYEGAGYQRVAGYGEYVGEPLSVCFQKVL